jgi:hypothetical protein
LNFIACGKVFISGFGNVRKYDGQANIPLAKHIRKDNFLSNAFYPLHDGRGVAHKGLLSTESSMNMSQQSALEFYTISLCKKLCLTFC